MLQNTFCHIPGIGTKTEQRLWSAGVLSWEAACDPEALPFGGRKARVLVKHAGESVRHLADGNARHFHDRLPANLHWRLFPEFRHTVAYLDIETTGLGGPGDYITAIALYDGRSVRTYVHGENLDEFPDDVRDYRLLVTYNGKTFDVPFIERFFGLRLGQAHIDLRYVLASLGYKGGLKGCERQLGLDRGELDGVDGFFAVLLWQDYRRSGNRRALETLLAYNVRDTVNLETLMVLAYNMKVRKTTFAESHALPLPAAPETEFAPDTQTIERIRREHTWF